MTGTKVYGRVPC